MIDSTTQAASAQTLKTSPSYVAFLQRYHQRVQVLALNPHHLDDFHVALSPHSLAHCSLWHRFGKRTKVGEIHGSLHHN